MLKKFINDKHFIFVEKAKDWEDAIKLSCKPLIDDKSVDEEYVDELIENVKKHGFYIVIAPGIALPHAQEGSKYIHKTGISFMKLGEPVHFDENDKDSYADLFFTLASCDSEKHLENMANLSELLSDENLVDKLHKIKSEDDLKKLSKEMGI